MFLVASISEKVDVDIWKAEDEASRLRIALDYLAPYSDPNKSWPQPTIREVDRMELFPILQMADRAYPDGDYMKYTERLPTERRQIERSNLAIPLMR